MRNAPPAIRLRGQISVTVESESTPHEGGLESQVFGDTLIMRAVKGSRYDVTHQMHELASTISATLGDPIESAEIIIVLRRPKT